MRGLLIYLPQFVRLFAWLMANRRVPLLAKLTTVLGSLVLLTPPAIELDVIPVISRLDGLLVGYLSLELFIWLCPPPLGCCRVMHSYSSRSPRPPC
jgi:membrane protein required for beta-lactamase induction